MILARGKARPVAPAALAQPSTDRDSGSEGDGAAADSSQTEAAYAEFQRLHKALRKKPQKPRDVQQNLAQLRTHVSNVHARQPRGVLWQTILEEPARHDLIIRFAHSEKDI